MKILKDLKSKPFGGVWSIADQEVLDCTDIFFKKINYGYCIENTNTQNFLNKYFSYIKESKNKLIGIENYQSLAFSLGTTNSFDAFYIKHNNKIIVSFAGEYVYHNILQRTTYGETKIINNFEDLSTGHALIISVPFADTGNEPEHLEKILDTCDKKDIPVLIDMAYINVAQEITINLNHKCIEGITSSLSKLFPLSTLRIGIRMQKENIDDGVDMISGVNYVNKLGIALADCLINNFANDYIFSKYKQQQQKLCLDLGVKPSKTVILGIDTNNKFDEYNRGGNTNRLCFSKKFETK